MGGVASIPVGAEIPSETLERLRVHAQSKAMPKIFFEREVVGGRFTGGGRQRAFGSEQFAKPAMTPSFSLSVCRSPLVQLH